MKLRGYSSKILIIFSILLMISTIFSMFTREEISRSEIDKLIIVYENEIKGEENNIVNQSIDIYGLVTFPSQNNFRVLITKRTDDYALRFAANYDATSSKFGSSGLSIIGGHRNDHIFRILKDLSFGDIIQVRDDIGNEYTYKVTTSPYKFSYVKQFKSGYVVDKQFSINLLTDRNEDVKSTNNLLLYTCFPFIFGASTEERFLVFAQQINNF